MRVLFVSSSSGSRGGGEFFLVYLAQALKAEGVEVGLWLSDDPQMDALVELFGDTGPVFRHPYVNTFLRRTRSFSHLRTSSTDAEGILEQWRAFRPDVLHLNKQCLEDGLDLLAWAPRLQVPHGCTIHITQSAVELKAVMGRLRDWVARRALRRYPGGLWAIAENRATALRDFVGGSREVVCIPNGVRIPSRGEIHDTADSLRALYPDLFGKGVGPVAVSIGRLEEQKDPLRFLDIVAAWKERAPGLVAIWVGDGRLREAFDARTRELGATGWVHCLGWQEGAARFLAVADVYIHPARFEGLPFALLEAMAYGLPCVIRPELASDLKDMPEQTWILAEENLQPCLEILSDNAALTAKASEARSLAESSFSLQAMARSYIKLYEDCIRGGESARR